MRVVHLSTSDRGGAGVVAARLHQALVARGIDSHLLTAYKFTDGNPNHIVFRENGTSGFSAGDQVRYVFKKALRRFNLSTPPEKKYARKYLTGRKDHHEYFSFPFSEL